MRTDARTGQFLFLNIGHLFDHMFMMLYATVVISLQDNPLFESSYGVLLVLSTWSFVAFGAGSLPAGWLGDKWSKPGMIAIFFLGIGTASILTGLASTPFQLGAGLLLVGVFASIYHPVGIAMVAGNAHKLGRELGINGVFGNIGIALAPVIAGVMIDQYSWRYAFIVPGVLSVFTGLAYVVFIRKFPDLRTAPSTIKMVETSRGDFKRILIIIAVATIFGSLVFTSTIISLPKMLTERLGDLASSTSEAGMWTFLVFTVAALAQIVIGHLLDRYPTKPVYFTVAVLQIPFLVIVATAAGGNVVAGSMIMMFLVFGAIPIHDTIIARHTTPEWRGRVYAVKFLLGLGIAATAVPMVGWMYDTTGGFETMFYVLAGCSTVVTCCALALPKPKPEQAPSSQPSPTRA